jgi:hypothetical protein
VVVFGVAALARLLLPTTPNNRPGSAELAVGQEAKGAVGTDSPGLARKGSYSC